MSRGDVVIWTAKLHQRYGDVVRIAPNQLSYINVQGWKDIYNPGRNYRRGYQKDPKFYEMYGDEFEMPSMFTASHVNHERLRRIVSQAFSEKALISQEPLFHKFADELVESLERTIDRRVDINKLYHFTLFDMMADFLFAEPLNLLQDGAYSPYVQSIFQYIHIGALLASLNQFWWFTRAVNPILIRLARGPREEFMRFTSSKIDRRLADEKPRPDFIQTLREQPEDRLARAEIYSNVGLLLTAGSETTASLLSAMTFFILSDSKVRQRLEKEVRMAFPKDTVLSGKALGSLTYLHACVQESLRRRPPVPGGLPRKLPREGAEICGKRVPGGTTVYMAVYATHNSDEHFVKPEEFLPERWLPDCDPMFHQDNKSALQAFTIGTRSCIAKR
jgi:cytochrome P450